MIDAGDYGMSPTATAEENSDALFLAIEAAQMADDQNPISQAARASRDDSV
jgi:hypothetical protein